MNKETDKVLLEILESRSKFHTSTSSSELDEDTMNSLESVESPKHKKVGKKKVPLIKVSQAQGRRKKRWKEMTQSDYFNRKILGFVLNHQKKVDYSTQSIDLAINRPKIGNSHK